MKIFSDNTIKIMAKSIKNEKVYNEVENFIINLEQTLSDLSKYIKEDRGEMNFDIFTFGSYNREGLVGEHDLVNVCISIENERLFNEIDSLNEIKSRKKRQKISATYYIAMLLLIHFETNFKKEIDVEITNNSLIIKSNKFFGIDFQIFIFTHSYTKQLYITTTMNDCKPHLFDIDNYETNFITKSSQTDNGFEQIVNIIKTICIDHNITNNFILIESLLYNVPNEYYIGDINTQMYNVLNYLKVLSRVNFVSIDGKNKPLYKNEFIMRDGLTKSIQVLNKLIG